jgi:DNA-directed RNA polymerase specialized sigma24 family protein
VRDGWPRSDADRAVAAFYRAHYRCLARIATLLLGNSALAEEIVQDAFVSVHHAWRHLRDTDEALGYLRRAVVSRARAQSVASSDPRSQPRDMPGVGPPAPGMPGALLIATLRGLPARQREALVLKYYADWPDPQIAAAMGISTDALNAHLRRGMSALRAFAAPNWGGGT